MSLSGTVDLTRSHLNKLDFRRVSGTQHVAVEVEDITGARLILLVTVEQFNALHKQAQKFHETSI